MRCIGKAHKIGVSKLIDNRLELSHDDVLFDTVPFCHGSSSRSMKHPSLGRSKYSLVDLDFTRIGFLLVHGDFKFSYFE